VKTLIFAGVAHWLNTQYTNNENIEYDKRHPVVIAMKEWIDKQYDDGRVTQISDKELHKLANSEVKKYMENK